MSGEAEAIGRLGTVDSASFLIEELFRRPTRAELLTGFVGLTIAGGILYVTTRKLWRYLLEKEPSVESSTKCGSWAVITGIQHALSEEFAYQLAEKGLNILLIGIDEDVRSSRLEQAIRMQFGVRVEHFGITNPAFLLSQSSYLSTHLHMLNISVLVNISEASILGVSETCYGSEKKLKDRAEASPEAIIIHQITQAMKARKQGVIINVMPIYGLETGRCSLFSQIVRISDSILKDLKQQYRPIILNITPYEIEVDTMRIPANLNEAKFFGNSPFQSAAYTYVRSALRILSEEEISIACWTYGMQFMCFRFLSWMTWVKTRDTIQYILRRRSQPIQPVRANLITPRFLLNMQHENSN